MDGSASSNPPGFFISFGSLKDPSHDPGPEAEARGRHGGLD